jgi:hypothetical protein
MICAHWVRRTFAVIVGLMVALLGAEAAASPGLRAGVWVTRAELRGLPESGRAWTALRALADRRLGNPHIKNQNSEQDVSVLAAALVYARTGRRRYADKAKAGIEAAIGTERGGRTLALARGLQSYVIAADLIDLEHLDPATGRSFRAWLSGVRTERLKPPENPTLIATHELRPNNWGAHAGASRVAADVYLGDVKDLRRAAAVFKGYLGDRAIYHGFRYGEDLSWQANPKAPVGIDPAGASKDGASIDGALPDDMRRGCSVKFPPCPTGYPWEALQGDVVQAEILWRQGYDTWNWGDRALLRAVRFLIDLSRRYRNGDSWAPSGDDTWIPWLINARYGTHIPTTTPSQPGKGMGFADWTYAGPRACHARDCTAPPGPRRRVAPVSAAMSAPADHEQTRRDAGHSSRRSSARDSAPRTDLGRGWIATAAVALLAFIVLARQRRGRSRRAPRAWRGPGA